MGTIRPANGLPKKGNHSVGVKHQYCEQLGKKANCQVAVSLSVASDTASLPVAYRLFLPKDWAGDADRRAKAGVPGDISFQTKGEIALDQIKAAQAAGITPGVVLADAGYSCCVNAMRLEDVLGKVPTDCANLHVDDPFDVIRNNNHPMALRCRARASSTASIFGPDPVGRLMSVHSEPIDTLQILGFSASRRQAHLAQNGICRPRSILPELRLLTKKRRYPSRPYKTIEQNRYAILPAARLLMVPGG